MDRSSPPSFLPPLHLQPFIVKALSFHPLPTSSPGAKPRPPGRRLHPPPVSLLLLIPASRAACLRLLPFLCRFASPFDALGLQPCTCHTLGGMPVAGPSVSLCPYPLLPKLPYKYLNCLVLVSVLGGFSRKVERPRRLHSLEVVRPGLFPLSMPA